MSTTTAAASRTSNGRSGLWNRQLTTYPNTAPRMVYLAITVIATVTLYYELYVGSSVSTLFLQKLHMGFGFYVVAIAFGNLIGAFGSLFAGLSDRMGRTNLVVIGLAITGIMTFAVIPASTNRWEFIIFTWVVGLVEGICLVATPALIRDFSPQTGRGTAMGFWTAGPVLGSLIVAVVASNTLAAHPAVSAWTHQYRICGIVGIIVAIIAWLGLKELSPGLRDQLMVSMHDRALVEAKAKGIDVEASLRNPWRQLFKPDVVVSAFGISVFLLVYYTAVGFAVIYLTTVFPFSLQQANGLGNWNWGFNVIAVILFGFISDRFRVRKPFMLAGGIASAVLLVLYLARAGHPTSYYHVAILLAVLSFCMGIAYVPWMASFTETVEARNPALTATGLAIWGWTVRFVVFASYLVIPHLINTVNPLVNYGTGVSTAAAQYSTQIADAQRLAPELAVIQAHPALFTQLSAHPTPALISQAEQVAGPKVFASIAANQKAIQGVIAAASAPGNEALYGKNAQGKPQNGFNYVVQHGPAVEKAAKDTPGQWKDWYWVCFGGMVFFLGTVPFMKGRWSPKKAKADEEAHEAMVQAEMAKLHLS
ncbi:MAG: MFS transporter [Acidimicrobiaceae bacterium]|nr:MFS transporter [Acidimicrobiaceae bacterium]